MIILPLQSTKIDRDFHGFVLKIISCVHNGLSLSEMDSCVGVDVTHSLAKLRSQFYGSVQEL